MKKKAAKKTTKAKPILPINASFDEVISLSVSNISATNSSTKRTNKKATKKNSKGE